LGGELQKIEGKLRILVAKLFHLFICNSEHFPVLNAFQRLCTQLIWRQQAKLTEYLPRQNILS
jgi:hypothetical protein